MEQPSVSVWKRSVSTAVLRAARSLTGSAGSRIRMPTCRAGNASWASSGARGSSLVWMPPATFSRRAGREAALPPILFGSHIDSPNGGNFDGDLGSPARNALEALAAAGMQTRHPLEMVVWSAEEGVAFGRGLGASRIVAGDIQPAHMDQVWNGMTRADAIRKIGGAPDRIMEAVRPKGAHHCYLELHIEQGGTLDRSGTPIGVVEGIVAIDRYLAVTGVANHAGT